MHDTVIIGIGNTLRGDDALGHIIANTLKKYNSEHIVILKQDGNITQLLDSFSKFSIVYLIDAIFHHTQPVGKILRIDALIESFADLRLQSSSHALDIGQTIEIARTLGQLPEKLIIYGIVSHDFTFSESLSHTIQSAVPQLITQLMNELKINPQ